MRRFVTSALTLLALAVGLFVIWQYTGALRGGLHARIDLANGRYRIVRYGLASLGSPAAQARLREQHGVEVWRIAFCVVSEAERDFAAAYNRRSIPAIEQRIGQGVIDRIYEAAHREAERNRPPAP